MHIAAAVAAGRSALSRIETGPEEAGYLRVWRGTPPRAAL